MQFVVEIYDPATECIAAEVLIEGERVQEIPGVLGWTDFDANATHHLDEKDILCINEHFGQKIDPKAKLVRLRHKALLDELPYQLHTNRELALMLKDEKPLSVFAGAHPPCSEVEEIPERLFDRYVSVGRFVKAEYIEPVQPSAAQMIRRVFYALPGEVWRIRAYSLLLATAKTSGWSEGFERMEGSLLGYTDEQNDAYMSLMRARSVHAQGANIELPVL